MHVQLECTYCGFKWNEYANSKADIEQMRCVNGSCKDTSLKVREISRSKIDYYQGCPPFPEELDIHNFTRGMY